MRFFTLTFFLCLVVYPSLFAQPQGFSKTKLDSLEKLLNTLPNDTNRVNTLNEIGTLYSNINVEKSILIGEEALRLIRKLNYSNGFRKILGPLSFRNYSAAKLAALTKASNTSIEFLMHVSITDLIIAKY